jgi:PAS domain S-box-containing protein
VQQSAPASGTKVESIKRHRDVLETKGELEIVRRKLARAERALDSLARVLSSIPEPIEVVSADYTVLFANRASRLLHKNEQIEGTLYYESVMGLDKPPEQCPIRRAVEDDREAAYTADCDNGDVYEVAVTPVVLSDGRRAAMCYSKSIAAGAAPREDDDNEKRVLQRIAEMSSDTLDAVLEQISDGVLLAEAKGEPILFNQAFCELTGFDGSDAGSLPGILFPDRASGTSSAAAITDFAVREGTEMFETAVTRKDGETVPVVIAVSRIPGRGEDDAVFLLTLRDFSETHEIKDQFIKALNLSLAGERIASLAHQVNNYLTPAFYHADKLAQRENLDRKTRQSVTIIQNYLNLCHESILMVLSLMRPAVPTVINMNHLISEVFSRHYLADELRLDNIEVVQRYDPSMVETMGYRVLLQQALANIIKNAQEAMAHAYGCGRLMVLTEATSSTITIRITDNGPGIPEDIQDKIFDLLFTTKAPGKGSGVGLHFTQEVVARHGGAITVKSRLDEGATFEIRIPVRPPEEAAAEVVEEAKPAALAPDVAAREIIPAPDVP